MLVVVSPAKKIDMEPDTRFETSKPMFPGEAEELAQVAGKLSVPKLRKLMSISENLAKLNADRFGDFGSMPEKPAALAFAGDTYLGLEAASLDKAEMAWAQDHLRILSGLYGLLRPLDAIEPYRLEMGSRLKTPKGATLYDFWDGRIAEALNAQAKDTGTTTLVNCASQEYFKAVKLDALALRVITPVFMEDKPGGPRIVSFFAKRARGAMARFIIQRRLTEPDGIKDFDTGGYRYRSEMSGGDKWVFLRDQADA